VSIFPIEELLDDIEARFTAESTPATNHFGRREVTREGHNRIVWVPGDDRSGDIGPLEAGELGFCPRSLGTLKELFTVYVKAYDSAFAEDEMAQYRACRLLFDAWWRAVYLSHGPRAVVKRAAWHTGDRERSRGAVIRALLQIEARLPDEPLGSDLNFTEVNATSATIAAAELDATATLDIP